MGVYIIYFAFIALSFFFFGDKNSTSFLKWTLGGMMLILGFRSTDVGVDTMGYYEDFKNFSGLNFTHMFNYALKEKEPLYVIFSWLVSQFSITCISFMLFWALLPCLALYYTIKDGVKTVNGQTISILCLFALGLFAFFIAGIRQTAAISVVLLAYRSLTKEDFEWTLSFIKSRRFIVFLMWMFIAYNLHNSSILFFIVLPLLKFKVSWWYFPFVLSLFFIGNMIKIGFLVEMSALFFDDRFASYGTVYESSQSINAFLMQFIMFTICYFKRKELISKDRRNGYLFNIMVVGLIFQSMSGMIYEMARMAFYFSIFAIILVPKAIEEFSLGFRKILYGGMTILLLIYLFFLSNSNLPTYSSSLF